MKVSENNLSWRDISSQFPNKSFMSMTWWGWLQIIYSLIAPSEHAKVEGVDPTPKPLLDTTASHGTVNTHSVHNTPCYFSVSLKKKSSGTRQTHWFGVSMRLSPVLMLRKKRNKQKKPHIDIFRTSCCLFSCIRAPNSGLSKTDSTEALQDRAGEVLRSKNSIILKCKKPKQQQQQNPHQINPERTHDRGHIWISTLKINEKLLSRELWLHTFNAHLLYWSQPFF